MRVYAGDNEQFKTSVFTGGGSFYTDGVCFADSKIENFFKSNLLDYRLPETGSQFGNILATFNAEKLVVVDYDISTGDTGKTPLEIFYKNMTGVKISNYNDGYGGKGIKVSLRETNFNLKIVIGITPFADSKVKQDELMERFQKALKESNTNFEIVKRQNF